MKMHKYLFLICSLTGFALSAQALELCGSLNQGEIVVGKTAKGSEVFWGGENIAVDDDGKFLIAFGRDDKDTKELLLQNSNGTKDKYSLAVAPTKWNIQNITGVPPRKVSPSDADLAAIDKENRLLRKAFKNIDNNVFWHEGFIAPVEGRISGEFGGQRIMNKIPKNPHRGMDIAAKEGTPVKASASGKVVLAYPDLFYSGNVVVIDHGFGLQTVYAHLKEIKVKLEDEVKQGDIIGLVGKTGRATGPHLHFGASLRNIRFNPQSLLDMNKNAQKCFTLPTK